MNLLFFTPHAALWPHTAPEAFLARGLAECGHQINYLTCGKAQNYCAPMSAFQLTPGCSPSSAKHICNKCTAGSNAIARVYRFPVDTLVRHLKPGESESLAAIAAATVSKRSLDSEYLGVRVGRIALYELTLAHKKMSTDLSPKQWQEYQVYLTNALISLQAFAHYTVGRRHEAIFTFSPQYSNINACMQYAMNQGTRVLFLESGNNLGHRLGTMRVWDWGVHKLVNPALLYWNKSEANPVNAKGVSKVIDHFRQLLSGYHFAVFSSPHAGSTRILETWGVSNERKVLLMTLSSYDEAYAALLIDAFPANKVFSDVFRTQAEWIKATIAWVSTRQDLFLIIRVHPRDFPNKRESFRSEQSFMLEELLKIVPSNVHVNWPAEGISFYDLLEDTDVILTGWSVTAMEALALGIPVVTYDSRMPSYPHDIMYTGRSDIEYYANIDRALSDGWRVENAINGFRWLAYNFSTCTVTVSQSFGQFELGRRSIAQRIWSRLENLFPFLKYSMDLLKWRDALPGAHIVSDMLKNQHNALPPTKRATEAPPASDDRYVVLGALNELHHMLYDRKKLPAAKPGLSLNIRKHLANEIQR